MQKTASCPEQMPKCSQLHLGSGTDAHHKRIVMRAVAACVTA
jgi:hypothetical protein